MALTAAHTLQVKKWVVGGGHSPGPFIPLALHFHSLIWPIPPSNPFPHLPHLPPLETLDHSKAFHSAFIPHTIPTQILPSHLSKMTNFLLMFRQHPFYIFRLLFLMAIGGSLLLNQNCGFASAAPFEPYDSPPLFAPSQMRYRRALSPSAANLAERGVEELPSSIDSLPIQVYALQRRSAFPAYANRRSAHPCRWKLCGAYQNYNSLGRFF